MHFKSAELILTFDQFWRVTGLKKTQVQNWTNGRPFKVRASIADASGKGSRNLYTLRDAYVFVFLDELRRLELTSGGIQRVLAALEKSREHPLPGAPDLFHPIYVWLVVGVTDEISITPVDSSGFPAQIRMLPSLSVKDATDRGGRQFAVNIAKIRKEVGMRWEKLSKRKATHTA
jgi:hypothetical protein